MAGTATQALSVVGKRLPRIDAVDKATGHVTFGVDVAMPGMLYGKILRSPYPHARLRRIDTAKAEAIPGVKAIITGQDVPANRVGLALKDEHILARDNVRYVGDAVAAVAAADEETAERAAAAIQVEYEELPAVFNAEEAMVTGAPLVHEELDKYSVGTFFGRACYPVPGTNICNHIALTKGDVEQGFKESDLVFEDTFRYHMLQHCHLEPHATVARVDPSGKITIITTTQKPFSVRAFLAEALDIPMTRIRVTVPKVGGGFGARTIPRLEAYCVLLAQKTGRPVKMVMTRTDEFTASVRSLPATIRVTTGVKQDGTILARQVELIWDTGAYSGGLATSNRARNDAPGPYNIPHVQVDSYLVYTNTVRAGSFRGLGVPQATWAVESQMDMISQKLGLDPVEFRLKNLVENGSEAATGDLLHSVSARECLERAAVAIGWGKPKASPYRGLGIACLHKSPTTGANASAAVITINEDGTVVLHTGATDIGQGSDTVLTQIAAEELGVAFEQVAISSADTETCPFDEGTFSTRVTLNAGNAVRRAAADARAQVLALASQELEVPLADLELRQGRVCALQSPQVGLSLGELARISHQRLGSPIVGRGSYRSEGTLAWDPKTGVSGRRLPGWKYGAQAAEVEIDPETGQVKVLRIVAVHDAGRAINPLSVEGQIEGGVIMGLGSTLLEEMRLDGGSVTNPSFIDYRIPTAVEACPVEPVIVEEPLPEGPFGAKGVGELSIIAIAPAIGNAICDAVGVRFAELPITPEKLLKALEAKGSTSGQAKS